MKTKILIISILSLICLIPESFAQTKPAEATEEQAATIPSSLGIYVFPSKDQSQDQQDKDEYACYKWAVQQTGVDPLNPPEVQAEQVNRGPDGAALVGSAKGAAVGAAIGAICGDAGKGAGVGAVTGALAGRRARRVGQGMEQAGANQEASNKEAQLMDNFKKAYSACLEGKNYTVK